MRRIGLLCVLAGLTAGGSAFGQNTTTRVSVGAFEVQANGDSSDPAISSDGRFVAFCSNAPNLVTGDTNNVPDIFVRDRQTGATERINLGPGGSQAVGGHATCQTVSISADGQFVTFDSAASNLVANDTNNVADIFVRDRGAGQTIRVSVASNGAQANASSSAHAISADGRYVAFESTASNLVTGDTNTRRDVFRHELATGTTIRINLSSAASQATGADSFFQAISGDGRIIAFASNATNLVDSDTNGVSDVFVRAVLTNTTGATTRVSIGPGGVQGNNPTVLASVSADGRFVLFFSESQNLVPGGGVGLVLHDRQSNSTTPLIVVPADATGGVFPFDGKFAADGRHICFTQRVSPGAPYDIFVIDRMTLTKSRVTVTSSGAAGNDSSAQCSINEDGTIVAFASAATDLVFQDTNGRPDVFVRTMFPVMEVDKTALRFGAVASGGTFLSHTAPQTLRLIQSGIGVVTWTAAASQPWLQVSSASGSGTGTLMVSVVAAPGLPPSGTVTGTVFISLTGATNTIAPIQVRLTLIPSGTAAAPFGTVDTPTDNRTGVTGAVPVTGWALDDVEVTRVSICRAAFGAEIAPVDPNCGGAAEIFIGFGVFIDGARPDVAGAFPLLPLATRGGWGFMVLTNFLPNQGNGTYRLTMRAQDQEGNWSVLGTRTMTCANASATLPFGTLDTPGQGGTASGASFVNFGWALTPKPKTIPFDGSTIHVLVDGVDIGTADYNHERSDITALFPGLNNTTGAVGFKILDTTALANGSHTISWTVTDDAGATEGLGSRFFTVANGVGAVTAAASAALTRASAEVDALPVETTPVIGRRGWDLAAPYGSFGSGASGVIVIRSEEVNRVELRLGEGEYAGYLRTSASLAPLPIGSRLDGATNTFTWAPGVGFIGRYDFVFVRSTNGRAASRREVRIILHPKGRGSIGPQVVVDLPRMNAAVDSPFMLGGWAVDLDAAEGTGVSTLHAWAFPAAGGAPIFLGATAYGGQRPDVAAVHGDRFKDSGFGLIASGVPAGEYDLAVFAWSTETAGFVAPTVVRVRVKP